MNESLTFEFQEIKALIDYHAEKLGNAKIAKILAVTPSDEFRGTQESEGSAKFRNIFKRDSLTKKYLLAGNVYKDYFERLVDRNKNFVNFHNLVPYLMVLFISD